ncbi:uncharacterized protein LOC120902314 [Anopheles arabiensis]|uniref:uncharacterized protein LOC120902314 n=1 Tax=Anopheles arabiensis TaxID=7173 RepID=UPI001AAD4393|nr:uncharacterized protein LOC120902314 [Anopheles arabiensis]
MEGSLALCPILVSRQKNPTTVTSVKDLSGFLFVNKRCSQHSPHQCNAPERYTSLTFVSCLARNVCHCQPTRFYFFCLCPIRSSYAAKLRCCPDLRVLNGSSHISLVGLTFHGRVRIHKYIIVRWSYRP